MTSPYCRWRKDLLYAEENAWSLSVINTLCGDGRQFRKTLEHYLFVIPWTILDKYMYYNTSNNKLYLVNIHITYRVNIDIIVINATNFCSVLHSWTPLKNSLEIIDPYLFNIFYVISSTWINKSCVFWNDPLLSIVQLLFNNRNTWTFSWPCDLFNSISLKTFSIILKIWYLALICWFQVESLR